MRSDKSPRISSEIRGLFKGKTIDNMLKMGYHIDKGRVPPVGRLPQMD